jgi:hypothetical protein
MTSVMYLTNNSFNICQTEQFCYVIAVPSAGTILPMHSNEGYLVNKNDEASEKVVEE